MKMDEEGREGGKNRNKRERERKTRKRKKVCFAFLPIAPHGGGCG